MDQYTTATKLTAAAVVLLIIMIFGGLVDWLTGRGFQPAPPPAVHAALP